MILVLEIAAGVALGLLVFTVLYALRDYLILAAAALFALAPLVLACIFWKYTPLPIYYVLIGSGILYLLLIRACMFARETCDSACHSTST